MSYVVKGYKFPQSCRECWLMSREGCHSYSCIFTGKYWEFEEEQPSKSRLPECPLVELPTPHGRLIDENELLRHKYGFSQTARTIIKSTNAVIEAEVSE